MYHVGNHLGKSWPWQTDSAPQGHRMGNQRGKYLNRKPTYSWERKALTSTLGTMKVIHYWPGPVWGISVKIMLLLSTCFFHIAIRILTLSITLVSVLSVLTNIICNNWFDHEKTPEEIKSLLYAAIGGYQDAPKSWPWSKRGYKHASLWS
jgi:hypothetical protein